MPLRFEPTVKVVNRLRDAHGNVIPLEVMYDGESAKIHESMDLPVGIARIIIHNSMFRVDLHGGEPQYKLGVEAWGMDVSPVRVDEMGDELIDRQDPSNGPRTTIHGTPLAKGRPIPGVAMRRDKTMIDNPGVKDGVFSGGFGSISDKHPLA